MDGHTSARDRPDLPHRDRSRLGKFFRGLEPRLTAVALRFTRDPSAAQDVVQNAFEKALRHGHRFRGEARVSTWMHRIVVNEALMWLRAERRRAAPCVDLGEGEQLQVADSAPSPAEQCDRRRRTRLLQSGVCRLTRADRLVLQRCALDGLSYEEFSAETGVHPAAAKTRAFRARRRLSALLAPT